ncbi:trihelix transcription factor PTL-like [Macadamia integrifolia]|uniref:trihelix transcription factor PTL-like n=1 Tax=Macadamia integrifolia TaxID=60698 RepID=UPI001C4FB893|nr:trihelix transcription factor PTL-like [Macadamia integrifolia]
MEMEEQYGLPDLRQLMGGRTHFPVKPQVAVQFSSHSDLTRRVNHYNEMIMGDHRQVTDSTTSTSAAAASALCGLEMAEACFGGDGGNGRWPRQETLTLLDIRSRLDLNFKEANQKGPLWDQISRIMAEEHGYQRSGKKCREKFENLYKYYKKTKDGKGGRQDGKHYRFFRQLEALYGETTTTTTALTPLSPSQTQTHLGAPHCIPQVNQSTQRVSLSQKKQWESLSLSSSSDLDSSSSEEKRESHHKRRRKSWKAKFRDFVDSEMRRLVETQEAWMEKMLKTLERKEQERMIREEAWRKEEAARLAREFKFWAHERDWVEARDAALMEALQKFTGREPKASSSPEELVATTQDNSEIQNENGSETHCVDNLTNKASSHRQLDHLSYRQGSEEQGGETVGLQVQTSDALSPSNSNPRNAVNDSCFRYLMAEEEPLWENYDVKLDKGGNP